MSDKRFIDQAKAACLEAGYVSVALIQRKLRIGYTTAANTMDALVEIGFCEREYIGTSHRRIIISALNMACDGQEPAGASERQMENNYYCRAKSFHGLVINAIDDAEAKLSFLNYLKQVHEPDEYLDYADLNQVTVQPVSHVIDAEWFGYEKKG